MERASWLWRHGDVFPVWSLDTGKMAAVAVVESTAGKDAIAEGLVDLLKPAIKQLDMHVHSVR